MITLNSKIIVNGECKIELTLPSSLPSGEYEVVIVLSEVVVKGAKKAQSKENALKALESFAISPGYWKTDAQEYVNQLRSDDRF